MVFLLLRLLALIQDDDRREGPVLAGPIQVLR